LPKITKTEISGVTFILITAVLSGTRPAISKLGTQNFPPILLACFTLVFSAAAAFIIFRADQKKKESHLGNPNEFVAIGVSSGIAMILLYLGLQTTSGIDASLFLQAELAYALVAGHFLLGEKITFRQVILTAAVFLGAIVTLWQTGNPTLNLGALMILAVPLFYVTSNTISKGLLQRHSPEAIIVMRQAYGALMLLAAALAFETEKITLVMNVQFLTFAAMLGIVMTGVSWSWYNAIGRVNLSKATAIGAVEVIVGVVMSCIILGEAPTLLQYTGMVLIIAGTVFLTFWVKSEKREQTART
jgi:drug/metabolite transporter (DMT)-like permease